MFTSVSGASILVPDQIDELLIRPTITASVAAQTTEIVNTRSHRFNVPLWNQDPSAAWVAEGAEIPVTDPNLGELTITPAKLAGLVVITRELAEDSSPAAATAVGDGLARDIARKLDAAYFGARGASPVQPAGLEDLPGVSVVNVPWTSLDPFAAAMSMAEIAGTTITGWVANPADALTLATLKTGTGSNQALLTPDPTMPGRRQIQGVPLLVSPAVTPGTIWGLPRPVCPLVLRDGATIDVDRSPFFTSDRVAVRATARIGFGWPHPAGVVKLVKP